MSSESFTIIDIRKTHFNIVNIKNDIIDGLSSKNSKRIPTIVLYDDKGLQIFEQITHLEEYYVTGAEIDILENNIEQIIDYISDGSSIIELGSGSLRKSLIILKSLEKRKKNITYYALDLMEDELKKSLSSLGKFYNVKLVGLLGTYEEGIDFAASLPDDTQKAIFWLGSSVGNMSREEGSDFIRSFQSKSMNPGDLFYIGIDRRNDPDKIAIAYNDPKGVTAEFIMNGLNHINVIFDQPLIDRNNFEYFSKYNEDIGRHEAYYKTKDDVTLEYISDDKTKIEIELKKDELINVEYSHKYSKADTMTLFNDSLLLPVESWTDSQSQYDFHLVYKPPFYFKRNLKYDSVPTIEEWKELWKLHETVIMNVISPKLMYEKPIEFRHPFIFYAGHIPAFVDIQLTGYFKEKFTEPQNFSNIFERGIDPDLDEPTKCNPHPVVPDEWPDLNSVLTYRENVLQRLVAVYDAYDAHVEKTMPRSLGRILWMSFEHEAMHVETSLYMSIQCKDINPPKGIVVPRWKPSFNSAQKANFITIPTQTITLGHDDSENKDDTDPLNLPFGWDNERPSRQVTVQSFKIQTRPVTNGEYLCFMKETVNKEYPYSWIPIDSSLFHYKVRTLFGPVDMNIAMNWPVMLSQAQACRYAKWKRMRLPTEEELRSFYDSHMQPDIELNIGFSHWHPTDVPHSSDVVQTVGSGWEWTTTELAEYSGFTRSKLYPGYSGDFFDGKHVIALGGSWATLPRMNRRTFRNWYQKGYPYVFGTFRLCD